MRGDEGKGAMMLIGTGCVGIAKAIELDEKNVKVRPCPLPKTSN